MRLLADSVRTAFGFKRDLCIKAAENVSPFKVSVPRGFVHSLVLRLVLCVSALLYTGAVPWD